MKSVAKRILNFIIIMMMLVSGTCFDHVEADSLFVHVATKSENHITVLTSVNEMPPFQTICTNEIAGTQRIQCHEVQSRRSNEKSVVRTGEGLSFLEFLPENPTLSETRMMEAMDNEPSGKEVIIAYIHHQDGEKDSV